MPNLHSFSKQKKLEAELIRAKDQAELIRSKKNRVLANLSHEMRTPINAINGIIHLLNDTDLTYQQSEYIKKLEIASNWLTDIVNNTMDFSKMEAGKLVIEKEEFSLRSTISRAISLFEQRVEEKELELITEIAHDVPDLIIGDATRTMQIINNFISNAIKFTDSGRITLVISVDQCELETVALKIAVRDTGIGIAADKHEILFQPFTQADQETARKYGGTGLGLTICKQLTELMDGEIWFESEVNTGSEFNVILPYGVSESSNQISEQSSTYGDMKTAELTRPAIQDLAKKDAVVKGQIQSLTSRAAVYRVLVVEDVKLNQVIVEELLKKCHIDVITANNGAEALELIKENRFHLILVDIEMPVMDGLVLTSEIRKLESPEENSVPIIAMSAHSADSARTKGYITGINHYLTKPINPDDFYTVINKWLQLNYHNIDQKNNEDTVELWLQELSSLALFDTNEVMKVIDGNSKLYKNLLIYFLSYLKELKNKLLLELADQDKQSSLLTIHDLKGIAGTIGACRLYQKCLNLENCFQQKWPSLLVEMANFCLLVNEYIAVLDNLFNNI